LLKVLELISDTLCIALDFLPFLGFGSWIYPTEIGQELLAPRLSAREKNSSNTLLVFLSNFIVFVNIIVVVYFSL